MLAAANSSSASYPPDSLRSKEDDIYIVTMLLLDMGLRLDKGMELEMSLNLCSAKKVSHALNMIFIL